jgi:hypothetical protein
MVTDTAPKRVHSASICGGFRYFLGICSVALAMVSIVVGFESSIATARSGLDSSMEIVNRTRKGDRLPLIQPQINMPRTIASDSKLADGCESLVSPLTHSEFARVAGRCES